MSLRELFEQYDPEGIATASQFATWAYDLLEALVEAVEPEKPTQYAGRYTLHILGELQKAKAEIKRLREERDSAELKLDTLKTIDERIVADAEVGRLVRGMPNDTALRHQNGAYRIAKFGYIHPCRLGWSGHGCLHARPAEALRSIQGVAGDDEA